MRASCVARFLSEMHADLDRSKTASVQALGFVILLIGLLVATVVPGNGPEDWQQFSILMTGAMGGWVVVNVYSLTFKGSSRALATYMVLTVSLIALDYYFPLEKLKVVTHVLIFLCARHSSRLLYREHTQSIIPRLKELNRKLERLGEGGIKDVHPYNGIAYGSSFFGIIAIGYAVDIGRLLGWFQ